MFPDPRQRGEMREADDTNEDNCFVRKQYPMLYMKLTAHERPSIADVQCAGQGTCCPLCQLDRNTLDSIRVLKPHEVMGESTFTWLTPPVRHNGLWALWCALSTGSMVFGTQSRDDDPIQGNVPLVSWMQTE